MIGFWFAARLDSAPESFPTKKCVGCGGTATRHVPLRTLPSLSVPYCEKCGALTRHREWLGPLAFVASYAAVGFAAIAIPFSSVADGVMLTVSCFALAGAGIFVVVSSLHVAGAGEAVRVHKLLPHLIIDCRRRVVAKALVKHAGGTVGKWRAPRLTPTFAAPFLALAMLAFGMGGAAWLFTSHLEIDHGGSAPLTVSIDGVRSTIGPHEQKSRWVHVGSRHIEWSTGNERNDVSVMVERSHAMLLNPGPTSCYWKEIGVYKPEHSKTLTKDEMLEAAKDGPLPVAEFQVLPPVEKWFEHLPERKQDDALGGNVDVAILRVPACSKVLAAGCSRDVATAMLDCLASAKSEDAARSCAAQSQRFCDVP